MGLIATDVNQTVEFSLAEDQSADKTVFLLRSLDMRERAFVLGRANPGAQLQRNGDGDAAKTWIMTPESAVDGTIWAIRLGLKGWRNFLHVDGKSVQVQMESVLVSGVGTREVLTEECVLRSFRKEWASEISGEILKHVRAIRGTTKKLTIAFQAALSPSLLKCGDGEILTIRDEATGDEDTVNPLDIQMIVEEYRDIVQFVIDWENGLFTMSKSDYETMPAVLLGSRRIYHNVRSEIRAHGNQSG